MLVTLLHCPKSKHGPYHLIYDLLLWPRGTVKSRGWANAITLYHRYGTQYDEQIAKGAWRYQCWRYRDIETLRADEARCGIDYDACIATYKGGWLIPSDVAIPEPVRIAMMRST